MKGLIDKDEAAIRVKLEESRLRSINVDTSDPGRAGDEAAGKVAGESAERKWSNNGAERFRFIR
ncbi:hypothetical protein F4W66_24300 (plasmid) [Escherichia coli]|nr:hypothetical protein F4W66_24300 [Escherichia coli]